MAFCPKCGAELAPEAQFCNVCGAPVQASNPQPTPAPAAPQKIVMDVVPDAAENTNVTLCMWAGIAGAILTLVAALGGMKDKTPVYMMLISSICTGVAMVTIFRSLSNGLKNVFSLSSMLKTTAIFSGVVNGIVAFLLITALSSSNPFGKSQDSAALFIIILVVSGFVYFVLELTVAGGMLAVFEGRAKTLAKTFVVLPLFICIFTAMIIYVQITSGLRGDSMETLMKILLLAVQGISIYQYAIANKLLTGKNLM